MAERGTYTVELEFGLWTELLEVLRGLNVVILSWNELDRDDEDQNEILDGLAHRAGEVHQELASLIRQAQIDVGDAS